MDHGLFDGNILSAADLVSLPPTLTHLAACGIDTRSLNVYLDEHDQFDSLWPRKLRHFSVAWEGWYRLRRTDDKRARMVRALPATITDLYAFGTFKDMAMLGEANPFPNLTSLQLKAGNNMLPQRLEPTLKSLNLSIGDLDPSLLKRLQTSSLTSLTMRFTHKAKNRPQLVDNLLNYLPIGITALSTSAIVLPSVLARLPPTLKRLTLVLSEVPTPSDILAMPCYHRLNYIELTHPSLDGVSDAAIVNVWPEATLCESTYSTLAKAISGRLDIVKQRSLEYPDPRVTGN